MLITFNGFVVRLQAILIMFTHVQQAHGQKLQPDYSHVLSVGRSEVTRVLGAHSFFLCYEMCLSFFLEIVVVL